MNPSHTRLIKTQWPRIDSKLHIHLIWLLAFFFFFFVLQTAAALRSGGCFVFGEYFKRQFKEMLDQ